MGPDPYSRLDYVVTTLSNANLSSLRNPLWLAPLIAEVGLFNDNRPIYGEYNYFQAEYLQPALWQHPEEFASYLILLAELGVRRYLDLGCFHGFGSVLTAIYLKRFSPESEVTAADLNRWIPDPQPPVFNQLRYHQPSTSADYSPEDFDCVLIDADHDYSACKLDFERLGTCKTIVFHDVNDQHVRDRCQGGGVWTLWRELKPNYRTQELLRTDGVAHMGIGILHNQ